MIGGILRTMYGRSGSVIFNDRCTFGISTRIRKNCARQQHADCSSRELSINRVKKCNCTGLCVPYNVRDKSNYAHVVRDENDGQEQEKSPSYANMIARYSSALKSTATPLNTVQKFCYEHNVSFTKSFEDLASLLKLRNIELFLRGVSNDKSITVYKNPRNNDVSWDSESRDSDWLKNVETIVNDLKRSVVLKEVTISPVPLKLSKYQLSHPTEETTWLDRVVQAHKANLPDDKSPPNDDKVQAKAINENNPTDLRNAVEMKGSEKGDANFVPPITDYLNRGPINQHRATTTEGSQNIVGGSGTLGEEPKVELRMSSSQNDSVVSINVDSISQQGAANSSELSVIVQSSKNFISKPTSSTKMLTASPTLQKSLESNLQNSTVNSKLKSMRISISEESVPVKQIEFAINGRPVSQLKSIIARTDKLDVVTSVDKIEIRVPFTKDKAKVSVDEHSRAVMPGTTVSKPVLNLQISANFDEPYAQQYGYTPYRAEVKQAPNPTPPPSSPPNPSPTPKASGSSGGKDHKFGDGSSNRASGDIPAPIIPRPARSGMRHSIHTDGHRPSDRSSNSPRRSETNVSPRDADPVTRNQTQIDGSSNTKLGARASKRSFTKVENKDRVPSNVIPWWSSEEAFNKLKKNSQTKRADSTSTNLRSRKSWPVARSENAKEVKRAHKGSATSRQKSGKFATSIAPFTPKKSGGFKKSRPSQSAEGRTAKNAGKKGREPFWERIPDVVQNVDGVSIKMKEKLDHDTIHVQDQLKSNGVKAKTSTTKSEAAQRVADADEKSKIFHRDSVIVKTKSQKSVSEKKPEVKSAAEQSVETTEFKPYIAGDASDRPKEEKKSENILLSDSAVKSFMDAMKPIEKRKDGTLIDFGMKVSSRRMPDKKGPKLEKMRSKSANVETVKVASLSKAPLTPTEKIVAKESKIIHDTKKGEPIISTESASEETKVKLSSNQQATGSDTKGDTDNTKIPERRISRSATVTKTSEATQTPQKPPSKSPTETQTQTPPKKADAPKPSSASTPKESPTKTKIACSSQTTLEPQKRRVSSKPSLESTLHDPSRTSTTPKKAALPEKETPPKDAGKKVATFSVERKMANVAPAAAQTVPRDNQSTMKTKVEPTEKTPTTQKTGADTNSVKEKKTDNDSRQAATPVTEQSLKRAAHSMRKGEKTEEKSSLTRTASGVLSSTITSDSPVSKLSKVALEAAEMKQCKSGFSGATKTSSETRCHHQQSPASKHFTKKDKPKCVNSTT